MEPDTKDELAEFEPADDHLLSLYGLAEMYATDDGDLRTMTGREDVCYSPPLPIHLREVNGGLGGIDEIEVGDFFRSFERPERLETDGDESSSISGTPPKEGVPDGEDGVRAELKIRYTRQYLLDRRTERLSTAFPRSLLPFLNSGQIFLRSYPSPAHNGSPVPSPHMEHILFYKSLPYSRPCSASPPELTARSLYSMCH